MFNSITKPVLGAAVAGALSSLAFAAPALATAGATATPQCSNAMLKASYASSDSGMGHHYGWIRLRNVSKHACVTGGFGGLSYVGDGNGTQIGAAATRDGSAATTYVLKPGQRVESQLNEVTALNYPASTCHRAKVDGIRVYVPNATKSQYIAHRTTGCTNAAVHLMSHRAYKRG
ncbi:MAG: hypothetical protein JWR35_3336 [Marmoricola sp.]|nr:hypothetical protein [Marmoricola sp.]